jgi:hypothetical protein
MSELWADAKQHIAIDIFSFEDVPDQRFALHKFAYKRNHPQLLFFQSYAKNR